MPRTAPRPDNRAPDNRYGLIFGLAALVALLDQGSKLLVIASIPYNAAITVIPNLFNLVHVHNRGAAFGFLNRSDTDWQFWLFLGATLLASGIIVNLARRARYHKPLFYAFGLILGGALGNLIDRVRLRAVIDFMDVYVGAWHWPAFNIADIAICVGAALAALVLWRLTDLEKEHTHVPD